MLTSTRARAILVSSLLIIDAAVAPLKIFGYGESFWRLTLYYIQAAFCFQNIQRFSFSIYP